MTEEQVHALIGRMLLEIEGLRLALTAKDQELAALKQKPEPARP